MYCTFFLFILILHFYSHHFHTALSFSSSTFCTFTLTIFILHFLSPHPVSAPLFLTFSYCTSFLFILILHFYPHHFHTALSFSSSTFCTFTLTIFILLVLSLLPLSALLPSPFSYRTLFLLILVVHFYPHHFLTTLSFKSSSLCTFTLTIVIPKVLYPHLRSVLLPSPMSYQKFSLLILFLHFYSHHCHTESSLSSSFCTFTFTIFILHVLSPRPRSAFLSSPFSHISSSSFCTCILMGFIQYIYPRHVHSVSSYFITVIGHALPHLLQPHYPHYNFHICHPQNSFFLLSSLLLDLR